MKVTPTQSHISPSILTQRRLDRSFLSLLKFFGSADEDAAARLQVPLPPSPSLPPSLAEAAPATASRVCVCVCPLTGQA